MPSQLERTPQLCTWWEIRWKGVGVHTHPHPILHVYGMYARKWQLSLCLLVLCGQNLPLVDVRHIRAVTVCSLYSVSTYRNTCLRWYITVPYKCSYFVFTVQYFRITKMFLGFRSGTYACDMSSVYNDSIITKGVCKNRYEALQIQIMFYVYDCNSYMK